MLSFRAVPQINTDDALGQFHAALTRPTIGSFNAAAPVCANRKETRVDTAHATRGGTEAVAVMRAHRLRQLAVGLVVAAACVLVTAPPVPARSPVMIVGEIQ